MVTKNKRGMGILILGSILVCLFTGLTHAQTTGQEDWVYIYDNPLVDGDDFFNDIRKSPYDGYIYCTGKQYRSSTYHKVSLHKLDPTTGDTIWTRTYNPAGTSTFGEGYEIDFDNAGYIYVAASCNNGYQTHINFLILKYDTAGNMLHDDMYNIYNRTDKALSVDVGPDNSVYVAGYTEGSDYETDFVVRKYDTSLTYTGCMYSIDIDGYNMKANRVRVDSDLNVWVAGVMEKDLSSDFTVVKLDTHMTKIGIYQKDGVGNGFDEALDLCLPWSGTGVYACGYLDEGSPQDQEFTVVKLDFQCNEEWCWTSFPPNNGDDKAQRIVNGPSDAVYAAGYLNGTGSDYAIICLGSFGVEWVYTYNGTANGEDRALDIELDASGNFVYATGYSSGTGTDMDIIVTKHSFTDSMIWAYEYDGPAGERDQSRSIHVMGDGNIYVAGNIELDADKYEAGAILLPQHLPPTIPELIAPANGVFLNDTLVTWHWNASTGAEAPLSSYYLGWGTDPTFSTYDSVWAAETTYTATLTDTTWYWAVKAQDSQGNQSDWSGIWSFSFDLTPPDNPLLFSPIDDIIVTDTSVAFEWGSVSFGIREVPSPVSYVLQVDTTMSFSSPIMTDSNTATATTLEFAAIDAYYYWRVKAYDVAGNQGPYSNSETFMVDITPPAIDSETVWEETAFCGPFDCYAKITDMWGIDVVLLYYKRMEDPAWFSDTMAEGSGDWYLAQIPAGTIDNDTIKYYYYAMDNAEYETQVPATDYYWFIANSMGTVEESSETPNVFSFNLRSNPIRGKAVFNLTLPRSASVTLEIYDASGRRIATPVAGMKSAGNHTITWAPSTSGIYFYSLNSPFGNKTGKLLFVR